MKRDPQLHSWCYKTRVMCLEDSRFRTSGSELDCIKKMRSWRTIFLMPYETDLKATV